MVTYCMSKHVILNKKVSWIIFLSCSCDELWKCKEMTKKDKLTSSFKEERWLVHGWAKCRELFEMGLNDHRWTRLHTTFVLIFK